MKKEMTITFHGTPDASRIATALSIILSKKYNADITVRVKGGEKDGRDKYPHYEANQGQYAKKSSSRYAHSDA